MDDSPKDPKTAGLPKFLSRELGEIRMNIRRLGAGLIAAMTGLLIAAASYASKPDVFRYILEFDLPIVDCGTFEVWTSGWERDTEKWWYDEFGDPVRLRLSINITESQYYNNMEPDKFVTQGKNGIGENIAIDFDLITGDQHSSGAGFRLTIPGVGHVLMDVGTLFWDPSTETLVRHGQDFALAEGETGLALCEALE